MFLGSEAIDFLVSTLSMYFWEIDFFIAEVLFLVVEVMVVYFLRAEVARFEGALLLAFSLLILLFFIIIKLYYNYLK